VLAAACIIALVLVQQGRGATMGAAFGSGASQTIFGSRGSGSFLFKVTMAFAIFFFVTSISLNYWTVSTYKQTRVITIPALPSEQPVPGATLPLKSSQPSVLQTALPAEPVKK
jgi:preprotein translocase subunit SecG